MKAAGSGDAAGVSVIVVSWNTQALLRRCLGSVFASPPPPSTEVWVVDNASSDGSAEMVRAEFPTVRLIINQANAGFARANNQALRQTACDYSLLLNSDAELLPDTLTHLWSWMQTQPRAGIAGPVLVNPDGSFQASYGDFPTLRSQLLVLAGLARRRYGAYFPSHGPSESIEPARVNWVGGACLLARRAAIEAVGLLDEDYFWSAEEMDWCYRMRRAGWEVFSLPAARCLHWGGQSSRQVSGFTTARLASATLHFFRKHYGRPRTWLLQLGMIILGLAKSAAFACLALTASARRSEWRTKAAANLRVAASGLRPGRWALAATPPPANG